MRPIATRGVVTLTVPLGVNDYDDRRISVDHRAATEPVDLSLEPDVVIFHPPNRPYD